MLFLKKHFLKEGLLLCNGTLKKCKILRISRKNITIFDYDSRFTQS